jgi:hypothetical protein
MVFLEALLFHTASPRLARLRAGPVAAALAVVLGAAAAPATRADACAQDYQEASAPKAAKPFLFTPSPKLPALAISREERLVYRTYLDALFTSDVGTVTQTCTVRAKEAPLVLLKPEPGVTGEVASIKLEAKGSYFVYDFESVLETSIQPEAWPRLVYRQRSESNRGLRQREVLLGQRDGKLLSSYRGDTNKGAPEGTRIWRPAVERSVPEGTLDMLTAVFMARALVRSDESQLSFPLIDKTRLWNLTLRRGERRKIETGAGTFDALEVVLEPKPYPGEEMKEKEKQFEGVFGIRGSIHLWVDVKTGIAVRIQGTLPVGGEDGILKLGIDVQLDSYSGTPPEFAPLPKPAPKR